MTQSDLTARIDEQLARPIRPPVYVEIVDPSGRVSYRRWSDHPDVQEALGTQGYTVRRCPQQPDLEGEVHPDRALLVEARAQLAAQAEAQQLLRAYLNAYHAWGKATREGASDFTQREAMHAMNQALSALHRIDPAALVQAGGEG